MYEKLRAVLVASDYSNYLHQVELHRQSGYRIPLSELDGVLEQYATSHKCLAGFHKSLDIRIV